MADMADTSLTISKRLKRKAVEKSQTGFTSHEKKKSSKQKRLETTVSCTFSVEQRLSDIKKLEGDYMHAGKLLKMETLYCDQLMQLDYGAKVTHVYNPMDYAYKPHVEFYRKYCKATARVLLIGENPGPFGGAQTGIPFGDVKQVREWLKIEEMVGSPDRQHDKRPVLGFSSTRIEGSGTRLWTFLQSHFSTPDDFFSKCFLYNYCPMIFMNASGANVTPSTMPAAVKNPLMSVCDDALGEVISSFANCELVVGIGRFTEQRVRTVCKDRNIDLNVAYLMHPSPRNPEASKDWPTTAYNSFVDFKLLAK